MRPSTEALRITIALEAVCVVPLVMYAVEFSCALLCEVFDFKLWLPRSLRLPPWPPAVSGRLWISPRDWTRVVIFDRLKFFFGDLASPWVENSWPVCDM